MEFLTANKNDPISRRVCKHFPCVSIIEISDTDLHSKIHNSKSLYVDWRLKLDSCTLLFLNVVGYKTLEEKANQYIIKKVYPFN